MTGCRGPGRRAVQDKDAGAGCVQRTCRAAHGRRGEHEVVGNSPGLFMPESSFDPLPVVDHDDADEITKEHAPTSVGKTSAAIARSQGAHYSVARAGRTLKIADRREPTNDAAVNQWSGRARSCSAHRMFDGSHHAYFRPTKTKSSS